MFVFLTALMSVGSRYLFVTAFTSDGNDCFIFVTTFMRDCSGCFFW